MADENIGEPRLIGHPYTDRIVIPTVNTRVRFRQEFHMKTLYVLLHDWFIEEGWIDRKDADWPEHFYLTRDSSRGKEMWIWWRLKKVPEGNSYYRFDMDIFWHIMGAKDIEVMRNGKKFKTNYADLELVFQSYIEMDYKHEDGKGWRDSPLLKNFHDLFYKRIFKADIEKHKHDLYRDTYRIQEVTKQFLGMRTYMPEPEGQEFWQKFGFGEQEGLADAEQQKQ